MPELTYISDLPSDGDTAYEGVIIQSNRLLISYSSNNLSKDYAWVVGMFIPSDIYMANISIPSLFQVADHPMPLVDYVPWDDYLIVCVNIVFSFTVILLIRKTFKT